MRMGTRRRRTWCGRGEYRGGSAAHRRCRIWRMIRGSRGLAQTIVHLLVQAQLPRDHQIWQSFDDATGIMTNDHSTAEPLSNEHKNVVDVSLTRSNPFTCPVASKEYHDDDSHKVFMDELAPSASFAAFLEPSPTSDVPSLGRTSADQVVLNPFDLPFDSDSEALDQIMDMSTLQTDLPNLPSSFLDGLPESWFSNNTSTYVPSGSHGGLPCFVEQVPNSPLRNITLSTVSTGNPFA